jgi:hypothetical protein
MLSALLQMSFLIACGSLWKYKAPTHISAHSHRRALTDLVFYILLPALVLDVIWMVDLNASSFKISVLAATGVTSGLLIMFMILTRLPVTQTQKGALLLAAAFPNATYLGLPVLDQVLGHGARAVSLQYDYFACTPILLSMGMLLAKYYGGHEVEVLPFRELTKIPPLWALSIGIMLNVAAVPRPEFIHTVLVTLSGGVIPLMLIVLGMSIRWHSLRLRFITLLLPVLLVTLIGVPSIVYLFGTLIELDSHLMTPVTLLAAMPTMVFGIVICERYGLDTELYAAAVTLTTITSLVTLPIWFNWLSV